MDHHQDRATGSNGTRQGLRPLHRISLTLAVVDAGSLWAAAVSKGVADDKLSLEDVLDVIGPPEDPSIEACIMMLVSPARIAGCALDDFWLDSIPAGLDRRSDATH